MDNTEAASFDTRGYAFLMELRYDNEVGEVCISAHICGISHLSNDCALGILLDLTIHSLFHSIGACSVSFPKVSSRNTYQKVINSAPEVGSWQHSQSASQERYATRQMQ
jgi:hypothetical protein